MPAQQFTVARRIARENIERECRIRTENETGFGVSETCQIARMLLHRSARNCIPASTAMTAKGQ
jgi:hypothetical protein